MSAQLSFKLVFMRYFSGKETSQKEKFDGKEEDNVLLEAALEELLLNHRRPTRLAGLGSSPSLDLRPVAEG